MRKRNRARERASERGISDERRVSANKASRDATGDGGKRMGSLTRSQSGVFDLDKLAGDSMLATAKAAATSAAAMVTLVDSSKVEMEARVAARIEKGGAAPYSWRLSFANDSAARAPGEAALAAAARDFDPPTPTSPSEFIFDG
jgi:hypothetical protein